MWCPKTSMVIFWSDLILESKIQRFDHKGYKYMVITLGLKRKKIPSVSYYGCSGNICKNIFGKLSLCEMLSFFFSKVSFHFSLIMRASRSKIRLELTWHPLTAFWCCWCYTRVLSIQEPWQTLFVDDLACRSCNWTGAWRRREVWSSGGVRQRLQEPLLLPV